MAGWSLVYDRTRDQGRLIPTDLEEVGTVHSVLRPRLAGFFSPRANALTVLGSSTVAVAVQRGGPSWSGT